MTGQTHLEHELSEPVSTPEAPGTPEKPTLGKVTAKIQHNRRPTHFVCFPLVTDQSVTQLSKSLAYFRSITTPLPLADRDATPERDDGHQTRRDSAAPGQSSSEVRGQYAHEALRVIPEPAHRPPGTFHLTLGVMYLPHEEDLERAASLLQNIDYVELLRRAESAERDEAQMSVPGERTKKTSRRGAREDANDVSPDKETQLEGQRGPRGLPPGAAQTPSMEPPKAENSSSIAEEGGQSSEAQHDARNPQPIGTGQSDTQQRQPTRNPDTSSHGPDEKGTLYQAAQEVGAILSSPVQPLKSLSRDISPPRRVSARLLQDDDSRKQALPHPLTISLTSLGTFPSPRSARVFYAHPHDPTSRLHRFGNLVRDIFREAGLITETRPLVLHATVANMIYVKGKGGRGRGGRGGRRGGKGRNGDGGNVDAREILRLFNQGTDTNARPVGVTAAAVAASSSSSSSRSSVRAGFRDGLNESDHNNGDVDEESSAAATMSTTTTTTPDRPFTWARDITIRSIRICKMGAEPSTLPGWGLEYRPVAEKVFMPETRTLGKGEGEGEEGEEEEGQD
ncbi:hypothetical protein AYL99_03240 [Fonsecaea erecta]|uniref:A-kinase anchor protein 7-like phosphoesterase domain-containing protein n=1 Tax=Fonsecaea erecta TaxID=1367422 RepID=A0A178ZXK5_9EURO|nr:hypothetical protein AYL99_03240 [Fonsecaea erecta]OAP64013.1 hypothetical protein AYL99_03240 [Fonsecaea erecta]